MLNVGGSIPRQAPLVRGLTIALSMNIQYDTMMPLGRCFHGPQWV